jgi:hypothetical protein
MSLQVRMLIASMALAASMGGCDRGWQEFQRVELGKPMPTESILRPQKAEDPNAVPATAPSADGPKRVPLVWGDWGAWPVPMSVGWHAVGVRADNEGRVIAKSYLACALSNYLLVKVAALRHVVEAQVPPSVLIEPGDEPEDVGCDGKENCRSLRSYILNAMSEVYPSTNEAYPDVPEFSRCLGMSETAFYMLGMSAYGGFYDLEQSIKRLPLKGITRQGYDRTFRPVCGGSIRLQNLGQGRIRVEMNLLRIYDPLMLMAYLYML